MSTIELLHMSQLPLQGGINFRDLGEHRGKDGRKVKSGMLLRSGALNWLTPKDSDYLCDMPVTNIIDYRDIDEVKMRPNVLWRGVQYDNVPADLRPNGDRANFVELTNGHLASFNPVEFMTDLYQRLPFNNNAYRHLVKLMQQPAKGALLQHCSVGKDRTGMGSALVLFALGASKETVIEDYMLSDITLAPYRSEILEHFSQQLDKPEAFASLSYVLSVQESFIGTALKAIEQRYGNVDDWLMHEYDLTPSVRENLQNQYLEN